MKTSKLFGEWIRISYEEINKKAINDDSNHFLLSPSDVPVAFKLDIGDKDGEIWLCVDFQYYSDSDTNKKKSLHKDDRLIIYMGTVSKKIYGFKFRIEDVEAIKTLKKYKNIHQSNQNLDYIRPKNEYFELYKKDVRNIDMVKSFFSIFSSKNKGNTKQHYCHP